MSKDTNRHMPKDVGLDNTVKALREGYQFIANRRHTMQSNVFETTLLGEKTICMSGSEAAKVFYDNDKFRRADAAPSRINKTLFGQGGVQGLDGEAHHHRKAMFMNVMNTFNLAQTRALTYKYWMKEVAKWEDKEEVVLYEECKKILTQVACEWVGIPLEEEAVADTSYQLGDLFESPAAIGPTHWKGRHSRSKLEEWVEAFVNDVREGKKDVPKERPLYLFSWHRDHEGELLDEGTVAVELLNLLRPMVAISIYIAFTAQALEEYPGEADKLNDGSEDKLHRFIQEVRRFYPFFPFVPARVDKTFTWDGYEFEEGTLTLMDLYGTNHHPKEWTDPSLFKPDRFQSWDKSPFDFIPQGGGDFNIGHRCAGEWLTIEILKESLNVLVNKLDYEVPEQDLSFSMNDMPSLPKSKMIITNVQRVEEHEGRKNNQE
ncbi:cytochrome P450 [Virgibacillus sp. NKC19-3]|uniref:cytochrome P450 n=1 Tax=Virgibacillus saliphilus TaxID=2831674 RepID=UPI001C9B6955|nr:cytochrome P450 [Virgibacillus sp. NKC19-3]MBY7141613.1 cytochrome P450 [Virgibacillus sp. NKC19-3]